MNVYSKITSRCKILQRCRGIEEKKQSDDKGLLEVVELAKLSGKMFYLYLQNYVQNITTWIKNNKKSIEMFLNIYIGSKRNIINTTEINKSGRII